MTVNTFSNAKGGSTTTEEQKSDIEILTTSKDTIRDGPLRAVFESVIAILALMRDEAIQDDLLTELARLCFRICRILILATKGGDTDSCGGLIKQQVEDFGSTARHIESVIRERANYSHNPRHRDTDPNEECITALRADLCRILDAFDGESERDNNLGETEPKRNVGESVIETIKSEELVPALPVPNSTLDEKPDPGTHNTSAVPTESSVLSPVLPSDPNPAAGSPPISNFDKEPLGRLVAGTVPHDALPALIEKVVLSAEPLDLVNYLQKDDAQTFVDVIDQALDDFDFPLRTRNKCVRSLYKTCAGHTLFPRSMRLEFAGNAMGDICGRGGFGIVSKREYRGREVAVKTLRPRGLSSQEMSNRFWKEVITWKAVRHPNVLPLLGVVATDNEFAMVSEWMSNGNIKQYIEVHQDANRFQLLADVAKGLVHIHSQGMIHRDLKGANILVDQNGRACLADFGLLTIVPVGTDITSSNSFIAGGTLRWMGPELFYPEKFGLTERRMTKPSDCYALGMVVYEVLSGKLPFHHYKYRGGVAAIWKIINGDRPERPQGAEGLWFADAVWNVLGCCWKPDPEDRPSVEDVLRCLEEASRSWALTPMIPGPPSADPLARHPNSCGEDGEAEDEPSSASQTILSEPSRTLTFDGPFPPRPVDEDHVLEPPLHPSPEEALWRLVNGDVPQDALRSLLEIVSNLRVDDVIRRLQRSDFQKFLDVVDQALNAIDFPPEIHNRSIRLLYKLCAQDSLFPGSLYFELPMGTMTPISTGGVADVFKCTYRDLEVAVKALRLYPHDGPERVASAFWREVMAWKYLRHPNVLSLLGVVVAENQFAMVSEWMPNGNIREFVEAHRDVNRFELLVGVARGLIYLHYREIVHGDLKGVNILVDNCGHPRLADFGLLRIVSDVGVEFETSSCFRGGTVRWMSPELIDPERYGFKDGRPTKRSDCYALGMVVYEVLSEKAPFFRYQDFAVVWRVINGERPGRPEGVEGIWFLDDIWNILERCWNSNPGDRPSIEDVLQCLQEASRRPWILPQVTVSPMAGSGDEEMEAPFRVPGLQSIGLDTKNSSLSEKSERNLGGVSPGDDLSQNSSLGKQRTHSSRERRSSPSVVDRFRMLFKKRLDG